MKRKSTHSHAHHIICVIYEMLHGLESNPEKPWREQPPSTKAMWKQFTPILNELLPYLNKSERELFEAIRANHKRDKSDDKSLS